jgi:hypothetical protein
MPGRDGRPLVMCEYFKHYERAYKMRSIYKWKLAKDCPHYQGEIMKRNTKYNVADKRERTSEGIVFASKMEMRRYEQLRVLEEAGEISGLILQPRYEIISAGRRNKAHVYTPDFQYTEDGRIVIEEVKGRKTPDYILRRDLLLLNLDKDITFREVTRGGIKEY